MSILPKRISPFYLPLIILIGTIFYSSYRLYHLTFSTRHTFIHQTHHLLNNLTPYLQSILQQQPLPDHTSWSLLKKSFEPYPGEFLILNAHNKIIYHSLEHLSNQQLSLTQLGQQLYIPAFENLELFIKSSTKPHHIITPFPHETLHVFTQSLAREYKLLYIISDNEIPLNHHSIYHLKIVLVILFMALAAFILSKICFSIPSSSRRFITLSAGYSSICAIGIILIMTIINNYSYHAPFAERPFLQQDTMSNLKEKHKNDIQIPTGIYIYSLSIPTPDKIFFTGYIWQKYHKNDGIERAIRLPQAVKTDSFVSYKYAEDDKEIVGWFVRAELQQQFDYTRYPFDVNTISIALEHPDLTKKIVLLPDTKAYGKLNPYAIPGIDVALTISGIHFIASYFSYQPYAPDTNFGLQNLTTYHRDERLTFNITLKRGILNAFIMYYLPLLIIFLSMFATVCIVEAYRRSTERAFSSIAAYTALFFSIILIHTSLRGELSVGEALYIEYLFFLTYIILLLLEIHALWTSLPQNYTSKFPYIEIIYWPLTLTGWLLITLFVFL